MVFVGLDPSFSNTGIAIAYITYKEIVLTSCGVSTGCKNFPSIFKACVEMRDLVDEIIGTPDSLISEVPPPQGQFSSGLYALDVMLLSHISSGVKNINIVYPNYLGHFHGKRTYKKSDSVVAAKKILEFLNQKGWKVTLKKRLSADMAEALIFLSILLVRYKIVPLESIFPVLRDEKEVLLR